MAASGSILPNPKWYFVDNNGEPLGSGFLYTRLNSDPTQNKLVYQDAGLTIPYPYINTSSGLAINIDANGTQGPIFWADDALYYIAVAAVDGSLQNPIWTMRGYGPSIAGGGGGGPVTNTAIDLENLVLNNTFWRNGISATGVVDTVTPVPAFLTIAPGAHAGLSGDTTATYGSPAPDICFIKNNTAAVDTLTFGVFAPGVNELTGDVTPVNYLHYESNAAIGETYKVVQFPICSGVQNLSGQVIIGNIWARWNSNTPTLKIYWRQFFGSGTGASADFRSVTPQTIPLISTDTNWHPYPITLPIPSVTGKTLGDCGNDGLFLQIEYPLNSACNIDFVKPSIYLGLIPPDQDFHTNDQIEAVCNDFRTGDVRSSLNAFAPFGWVPMNDLTIGSQTSGATARANKDTFPLYALLWNGVSDTYAPVITGRGATAIADFDANKQLTLTRMLGRALASDGAGSGLTSRALGEYGGTETHALTIAELAAHTHGPLAPTTSFIGNTGGAGGGSGSNLTSVPTTGSTGSGTAFGIVQPTSYINMFIKL